MKSKLLPLTKVCSVFWIFCDVFWLIFSKRGRQSEKRCAFYFCARWKKKPVLYMRWQWKGSSATTGFSYFQWLSSSTTTTIYAIYAALMLLQSIQHTRSPAMRWVPSAAVSKNIFSIRNYITPPTYQQSALQPGNHRLQKGQTNVWWSMIW